MNKTKTKKLQKPIDADIHLKYRCKKCGMDHWLSFKEASTKDFKVVCGCGVVFKVKRLSGFKFKYKQNTVPKISKTQEQIEPSTNVDPPKPVVQTVVEQPQPVPQNPVQRTTIPSELLEKSVKLLLSYGFTKTEATKLVTDTYFAVPVKDYATLVKYTLQSIGDSENGINDSSPL